MAVNGVPLVTKDMWDYIVPLWLGLLSAIKGLSRKDESSTYFPDQPILFEMKRIGGQRLEVSLSASHPDLDVSANADEKEFVLKLTEGGEYFFSMLLHMDQKNRPLYEHQLESFTEIRAMYS